MYARRVESLTRRAPQAQESFRTRFTETIGSTYL